MTRAVVVLLALLATPALAFDTSKLGQGGSLTLDTLAPLIDRTPRLKAEVERALAEKQKTMDKTICVGMRFPGAWTELGGARVAPYDCDFAGRWLHIDARVRLTARDGREFKRLSRTAMGEAVKVEETNLRWRWSDKAPPDWDK